MCVCVWNGVKEAIQKIDVFALCVCAFFNSIYKIPIQIFDILKMLILTVTIFILSCVWAVGLTQADWLTIANTSQLNAMWKISVCFVIIFIYIYIHTRTRMFTVVDTYTSFFPFALNVERQPFCFVFVLLIPTTPQRERKLKSFCAKIDLCLIKFALLHAFLALRRFEYIYFFSLFYFVLLLFVLFW